MKAHTSQKPLRSTLPSIRFVQTDADKSKPVGELPEQKHELVSQGSRKRRVHIRRLPGRRIRIIMENFGLNGDWNKERRTRSRITLREE
jgi:hypothetical protein